MNNLFLGACVVLASLALVSLYRAYKGPTPADRVVAINVISTKVTVMIAILAVLTEQDYFVDVALVYGMMGFMATVGVSKYLENGKLF